MDVNKKLIQMLDPYIFTSYEYGVEDREKYEEDNQKAKEGLSEFYTVLTQIPVSRVYDHGGMHTGYLPYLLRVRQCLEEERYYSACSKLQTLIYKQPIQQSRIYYNVLRMLEHYLDMRGDAKC